MICASMEGQSNLLISLPAWDVWCRSVGLEIAGRVRGAAGAFGALDSRVWSRPGIGLEMGCGLCRVFVLPCLLCSAETWTLFQGHVARLSSTQLWRLGCVVGLRSVEGSLVGVLGRVGRESGVVG